MVKYFRFGRMQLLLFLYSLQSFSSLPWHFIIYTRKVQSRTPVSLHLTGVHICPRTEKIRDMKTVVILTANPTFKSGRVVGLICWTRLLPFSELPAKIPDWGFQKPDYSRSQPKGMPLSEILYKNP
jgi:hypothetical protein